MIQVLISILKELANAAAFTSGTVGFIMLVVCISLILLLLALDWILDLVLPSKAVLPVVSKGLLVGASSVGGVSAIGVAAIILASALICYATMNLIYAAYYAYNSDSLSTSLNDLINPKHHLEKGFSIISLAKVAGGIVGAPFLLVGSCIGRLAKLSIEKIFDKQVENPCDSQNVRPNGKNVKNSVLSPSPSPNSSQAQYRSLWKKGMNYSSNTILENVADTDNRPS